LENYDPFMKDKNKSRQKLQSRFKIDCAKSSLGNTLELDEMEAQFGLLLRDKSNHDNYVLIKLDDLDRIFKYFADFKQILRINNGGQKI